MLFEIFYGVISAILIFLCQLSLGTYLDQRWIKKSFSFVTRWALGLSVLAILNTLMLAFSLGLLIHLNALCLLLLFKCQQPFDFSGIKNFKSPLIIFAILLFVSYVLSPISEWDAQSSYLYNARFWQNQHSLNDTRLWHCFAQRPQIISIVYTWGYYWGNGKTCQLMDLFFLLGGIIWVAEKINLNRFKFVLMILLISLCTWDKPLLLSSTAIGGNDLFICLIMLICFEVICEKSFHPLSWLPLSICLINTRWTGPVIFFLLLAVAWKYNHLKGKNLLRATFWPLVLGCVWHIWFTVTHGNPVYPNFIDFFGGSPLNEALLNDYSSSNIHVSHFKGLRSLENLWVYLINLGYLSFLFPFLLWAFIKTKHRTLLIYACGCFTLMSIITSQWRFQYLALLIFIAIVLNCEKEIFKNIFLRIIMLLFVLALSLKPLNLQVHQTFSLLRDLRHGQEYLLENRVRLYPACRWLNENGEKNDLVLWPMNPYYHCQLNGIRADEVFYRMSDAACKDPQLATQYFKDINIKWIVVAPPMYEEEHFKTPTLMKELVNQIILKDPSWEKVVEFKKIGVSPATAIYKRQ